MQWPSILFEEHPWSTDGLLGGRNALRRHRGPYRAAVPAPIADIPIVLATELAALVEDATSAIIRFDSEMGAEIAPFTSLLLRTESAASSRIENLTASAGSIAEAELLPPSRSNASLIVASTHAMQRAVDDAAGIDDASVLSIHRTLLAASAPTIAGQWRTEQVWIGGSSIGPHEAIFVPPHADRLPEALQDFLAFVARADIPVLAHAALAHAQFETIHPFADGNGRVGRAIMHAQLRRDGVTTATTVPLSAGLLADVDRYFDTLTAYRAGNPEPIIECVAEAAFTAITNGRLLVGELRALRAEWATRIPARRGSTAWSIADLLIGRPMINAAVVADELGISAPNVYRAITPLLEAGIVREVTDKKRNRKWRADEVLACLDRFAGRSQRRGRPTEL